MNYIYFINKDKPIIKEPSCLEGKIHNYQPHNNNGNKSDFVDLCDNCGLSRMNPDGIYSRVGWKIFKSSLEYEDIFQQSLRIKEENGLL